MSSNVNAASPEWWMAAVVTMATRASLSGGGTDHAAVSNSGTGNAAA